MIKMPRRQRSRVARLAFVFAFLLSLGLAALPADTRLAAGPKPAAAETLASPRFVSAAVLPNGNVGLVFLNVGASSETRFVRYSAEHALLSSVQLSTAAPWYPQIAVFRGTVVAAYVDTRAPNAGKLVFRTSGDNGATWSAETTPFGSETFDLDDFTPAVVASRDAQTLYVFSSSGQLPKYRSTTDTGLVTWSTAADAGDASMAVPSPNNCGNAGQECYRAHGFSFMETATAGNWVYVAKSASGFGQSGRGTQVGTLGGSWSTQVDHFGSGGLSGGGQSSATTFLGRDGSIYYIRAAEYGDGLYYKKSTDGGYTWGGQVSAYAPSVGTYVMAAPVGVYDAQYTYGEYVWFAGFGGTEDTVRVIPLWRAAAPYVQSGTTRLFGSAGSDLDRASAYEYNFGAPTPSLGAGGYTAAAADLELPGRILPLRFTRTYSSADPTPGPLGPGWTHSYDRWLAENGDLVTLHRGDGAQDRFTRNPDGSYHAPPGVSDVLTKNPDGSFTLTTREQVSYEFGTPPPAYSSVVLGDAPAGYWRLGESAGTTAADAGPNGLGGTYGGTYTLGATGALTLDTNTAVAFGGGNADMGSPGALNISGSALTVEFWARGTPGTYNYLVSHTDGGSQGYAVYTGGDAGYHFYVGRGGGLHITGSVAGVWDGEWHHFANVYDGAHALIYVDGVLRLSEPETASLTGYAGNFRLAGYNGGGFGFSGTLDEVAVYATALSATAVSAHYQASVSKAGLLSRIHEPAGNQIALGYRGRQLATITDTAGRAVSLSYDAGGRLEYLTDPLGRTLRYGYDVNGRLASVWDKIATGVLGPPSWQYAYAGTSRHLTTVTDPDGRAAVTNAYDSLGQLATQTDGLSKTTAFAYPAGQVQLTDPRTHVTTRSFDARNRLVGTSDTVGASTYTTAFTYDDCGNRSSATDRNGHRTDFGYDTGCKGNLLTRQEPQLSPGVRFTTTYAYDAKNNLTTVTDAKGFVRTFTYHASSNVLLSATAQIDGTTSTTTKYEYGDTANPGLPTKVIAPRGNTTGTPDYAYATVLAYDTQGNLTSSIDPDGFRTTHTYDTAGRRLTTVDPDGNAPGGVPSQHTWTTAYDPNDRVTAETDPLGHATAAAYDGAGNRISATDKNGNLTTSVFDGAGRLWKVRQQPDPAGQPTLVYETVLARDDNGNPTSVTQANGTRTDATYDALNRRLSTTVHPAAGVDQTTTRTLDGNGNTRNRTTPDGVVTSYGYDPLDRLTQVSATGLATISYAYDELHRRTQLTDGTGTTTYGYDRLGRLTAAAQPNGTLGYGYDRDGNRTSLVYPGANTVSYAFSNAGRLSGLTDWASRATAYTYTPAGLPATVTLPNGLVTTTTYDRAQRPTAVTNVRSGTTITSHAYALDGEGNRTGLVEFVSGITPAGTTETFTLGYDGLSRLTGVATTNAESFTLDAASNLAARTGPAATYTLDGANRPTSDGVRTFTWSAAGQLTTRGSDTFAYDPLDRLTRATVAGTARTYAYSGDGLLQSRSQLLLTTSFLWDPASSPSRLLQQGTDRLVYGLGPLYAVSAAGTTTTFAPDALGSVRAELSDLGLVSASFRYRSYGELAQASGLGTPSSLGFAGELADPSGLLYLRARWYDPQTGRFLTTDPVEGDPTSPVSLNAYMYGAANPVRFTDPSGKCPSCMSWLLNQVAQINANAQSSDPFIANYARVEIALGFVAGGALLVAGGAAAVAAGGGAAAGVTAAAAASTVGSAAESITVRFGHGGRHVAAGAIEVTQAAIREDIAALNKSAYIGGEWRGGVQVADQWVQYHAYEVSQGVINVGTYIPVQGLFGR